MGVRVINDDFFSGSTKHDEDLPDSFYEDVMENGDLNPGMSPQNFHENGYRWQMYLAAGSFRKLQSCWFSMLLQPGMLLRNIPRKLVGLVICANEFGSILWKLRMINPATRLLTWASESQPAKSYMVVQLEDIGESWVVLETGGVAPAQVQTETPDNRFVVGIRASATPLSVGAASARGAFKGMIVTHLQKLFVKADVKGKRPDRELPLVEALARHFLPTATDAEIQEILTLRRNGKPVGEASILEVKANMDLVIDAIPEDDQKEFDTAVKKAGKKREGGEGGDDPPLPPPSAGGGASGSGGGGRALHIAHVAPRVRKPIPRPLGDDRISKEWIQALLPDAIGCRCEVDTTLHFRIKVMYKVERIGGQSMATAVWNEERPAMDSVRHCVEWAWAEHFLKTGQKCPFVLSLLPDVVLH
jgi:hypothetical protein